MLLLLLAATPPPAPVPVYAAPDGGSQVILSSSTYAATWVRIPDCAPDGGNALNYTASSRSFSCGSVAAGGGGGGAPTTAQYWVGAADGTLSAEKNLGVLATGLVINTAGTPSAYAGATCGANQYATQTSASGALTCSQVSATALSGTVPQSSGGTGSGALTCAGGDRLTSNGTVYSCSALPVTGVTSPLTLISGSVECPAASGVSGGCVTTATQTFEGQKIFNDLATFSEAAYSPIVTPSIPTSLVAVGSVAVNGGVLPEANGTGLFLMGRRSWGDNAANVEVRSANWRDGGVLLQVNSAYPCNASQFSITNEGVYYGEATTPACGGDSNADLGALVHARGVSGSTSLMALSKQYLVAKGRLADNQDAIESDGGKPYYDGGTWVGLLPDGGTFYQYGGRHGELTVTASGPKYGGLLFEVKNAITGTAADKVFGVGPYGGIINMSSQTLAGLQPCPGVNIITSLGQYFYGAQGGELTYASDTQAWYVCRAAGWTKVSVAGDGYATIQDEGTPLTQRSTVNFTGAGVTCTDSGGITVCTIAGGGGGGGGVHPLISTFGL